MYQNLFTYNEYLSLLVNSTLGRYNFHLNDDQQYQKYVDVSKSKNHLAHYDHKVRYEYWHVRQIVLNQDDLKLHKIIWLHRIPLRYNLSRI